MSGAMLHAVRVRVQSGELALDADLQSAVAGRIDDLLGAIAASDRALSRVPRPDVSVAAAKLAYTFYISGHGWRRYLAESPQASVAGAAIQEALLTDIGNIVRRLEAALTSRKAAPVSRRGTSLFGLPCAACDGDAVTLTLATTSPVAPEQLVVSSLSPVTVFRPVAGPRMRDVIPLLEAGNALAVVKHLRETQPAGCDAYCDACTRLFCREHYAIEAQWSGSWHESTFVTCPLGHEHEID